MKDDIRREYKKRRKSLTESQKKAFDCALAERVEELFKDKNSFFIYYSFGSEPDTKKLIARLISLNKRVFLPRVEGGEMVPVEYTGEQNLTRSPLGVSEPEGQAYPGDTDVIIVPLLAVNGRGYRVGYGGGYYDKFLKNSSAVKAGIGYEFQLTDDFTEDEWDEPLDIFITERGIHFFGDKTFS